MQIDNGIFDKSCCGLPNRNDGLADSNDRMGFSKEVFWGWKRIPIEWIDSIEQTLLTIINES